MNIAKNASLNFFLEMMENFLRPGSSSEQAIQAERSMSAYLLAVLTVSEVTYGHPVESNMR